MDNPHVLVTETELAYLAGIIDGEGCISINHAGEWKTNKSFQCKVRLANSNLDLINWVMQTLEKLGIKGYIAHSRRCENNPKWKRVYDLGILNQTKCHTVLSAIRPYLVSKRAQADLVLEWIDSRWNRKKPEGFRYIPYSKRELEIVQQLKVLNQRGTSQTVDYELAEMIAKAA